MGSAKSRNMPASQRQRAICPICSLQDGFILQWSQPTALFTKSSLFAVDYDGQNPINEGSLCPRGNSVAELVDHPLRLNCPQVDGREVDWPEALTRVADGLQKVIKAHGPESVAILTGGSLGLEEALGVGRLARDILGTPHVAPLFPDDGPVFSRLARLGWDEGFTMADLQGRQATLLIGDVFCEHPVISKRILKAKYGDRSHRLFVLDAVPTQTTWFAHQHLQPAPGTEALVLAALAQLLSGQKKSRSKFPLKLDLQAVAKRTGVSVKQMETVASDLSNASDGAVIQSSLYGRQGRAGLCALLGHALSRLLAGRFVFLHLPVYGNARGVHQMLAADGQRAAEGQKAAAQKAAAQKAAAQKAAVGPKAAAPKADTGPGVLEQIQKGEIRAVLLFGIDPLSAVPSEELERALGQLDLLCDIEPLPTLTTPLAHVLLPGAIGPEKDCRWLYLNGDIQDNPQAIPPPGLARPDGWFVGQLAERLSQGKNFTVDSAAVDEKLAGGEKIAWSELLKAEGEWLQEELAAEPGEVAYPLFLVPAAIPAHLGDGATTRHLTWSKRVAGEPCVWASAALMKELNVSQGDRVQVSSKPYRAILPIMLNEDLPDNVITAPAHFPEVRRLFSLRTEAATGELDVRPERVSVSLPKEG
jgi:anaerobic selenocysteine-containing dehydrogenase